MRCVCIVLSTLLSLTAGAAAAQASWQQEWANTVDAARKEGVVTVSGPPGVAEREAVLGGWQKAYPDIRIDYTGARGTQILSKVVRERQSGLYNWDIVLASTDPTVFMLPPIHALAPLREALINPALSDDKVWVGGFAEGFVDDARLFFYSVTGSAGTGLGYVNRDCVPRGAFSRADDLMKPEFKGKIASSDPLMPGTGSRGTWRLTVDRGDAWLKAFYVRQEVTFSRDYRQLTEWLVTCSKPIVIGIPSDALLEMQKQGVGKNIEVLGGNAYLGDHGLGWAGSNNEIGWYANAPHPNAAKLFVNLYLSRDFQQRWSDATKTDSRRIDVKPGDPDPSKHLDPALSYEGWGDEASIRQVNALQAKIQSWGIVK